jgi:hypothetical protein
MAACTEFPRRAQAMACWSGDLPSVCFKVSQAANRGVLRLMPEVASPPSAAPCLLVSPCVAHLKHTSNTRVSHSSGPWLPIPRLMATNTSLIWSPIDYRGLSLTCARRLHVLQGG